MSVRGPVLAAGGVVLRRAGGTAEVVLVHRPKYDDWTFPKGKVDPGEAIRTTAVREVAEETGLAIRLGPPLSDQSYVVTKGRDTGRRKVVHWWIGRARGDDDVAAYPANDEVDAVAWVAVDKAEALLTYDHDRAVLEEALALTAGRRTHPVLVIRHGQAHSRRRWRGDDRERTLSRSGERQAERIVPTLAAYGVRRLVTSGSRRCWTTVAPYGVAAGLLLEETDALSEEDATPDGVAQEVAAALARRTATAICSHRPVLPLVFEALGLQPTPLEPAGIVVVHHRRGRVLAVEGVPAPSGR